MFGSLAPMPGEASPAGFVLAFQGLATIIFFASLMQVLYYAGIMPWIIRRFAWVFTKFMRISGAESLCTAANIFVGVESGLAVRPYIETMTKSELCTILTACMATVASSVMGLYVGMLETQFPTIAGHLVTASILSAPAAIACSKLLLPETETPQTLGLHVKVPYEREANVMVAAINGANTGLQMALAIGALLIAFVGFVALANQAVGFWGQAGGHPGTSLEGILGWIGYPFALVMGVPPKDAHEVGRLLGMRAILTEVPCYMRLGELIRDGTFARDSRTVVLTTYALCGFAHVASLAIFVGGFSALAPSRTADLSRVGIRALVAATIACLMTGCVAGVVFPG